MKSYRLSFAALLAKLYFFGAAANLRDKRLHIVQFPSLCCLVKKKGQNPDSNSVPALEEYPVYCLQGVHTVIHLDHERDGRIR